MAEKDFITTMENLGAAFGQDCILVGTPDGNVVLLRTNDDDPNWPRGTTRGLDEFPPTRIGERLSRWKDLLEVQDTRRRLRTASRRDMGFMGGFWLERRPASGKAGQAPAGMTSTMK